MYPGVWAPGEDQAKCLERHLTIKYRARYLPDPLPQSPVAQAPAGYREKPY